MPASFRAEAWQLGKGVMEGWTTKSISEVVIPSGTIDPRKNPDVPFQYVDVSSISNRTFDIVETSEIIGKNAPSRARRLIKSGDVLFATIRPTLRRIALVPEKLDGQVCSTGYFVFRTKPELESRFLYYYLFSNAFMGAMEALQSGASYPAVNDSQVKQQRILFPPLPEQKRIVAILDETFAGISQAVANAEKNLANVRELFESHLNNVFTRKDDGWVEKTLQEILSVQPRNGWSPPAKNHSTSGTPVLTLSSVTGFQFDRNKIKHTCALTKEKAHYWLNNGEFLITRSNTPELVGHVAICDGLVEPTICCDLIMKMQIDPKQAETKFLYWQFRTLELRKLITNSAQGANPTMKKINKGIVQNFPVKLPPLSLQKSIVTKLDELAGEKERLEDIYKRKLSALAELKQSILQKAFAGELTSGKLTADAVVDAEAVANSI